MINETHGEYVIREVALTRAALEPVIELHHQVLPSRLYVKGEKKKSILDEVLGSLNGREHLVLGAFKGDTLVGYKLAYRTGNRRECLYSWLGGVHPHHRRKGLARAMTRVQHVWGREHDFLYVETHTWGDNPGMLILNLQEGFFAAGALSAIDRPGVRIIMRKLLK